MSLTKVSFNMIQGAPKNVLDYGADPTGTNPSDAAFQAAVNAAIADGSATIFIPLSNSQKYRLSAPVVIDFGGFAIIGDGYVAADQYGITNYGGYIYGDSGLTTLFDYGNSSATNPATGRFVAMGLQFIGNSNVTNAIRITRTTDGPDRDMLFMNIGAKGFDYAIEFNNGANKLAASTVTIQDCSLSRNLYGAVNCVDTVLGIRYVGNLSEQGGQLVGKISGPTTISDNMFEGQNNTININVTSGIPITTIQNNYFESNGGDYVIRFEGVSQNSSLTLGNNYYLDGSAIATDFLLMRSGVLIEANRSSNQISTIDQCFYNSELNGLFYSRTPETGDPRGGFCVAYPHRGQAPSSAIIETSLGASTFMTPFGQTTTGLIETGTTTSGTSSNYSLSYTTDDLVVTMMLFKGDPNSIPTVDFYNQAVSSIGGGFASFALNNDQAANWQIAFNTIKPTVAGTGIRFRANAGVAGKSVQYAGFGAYVIPAASFITKNGEKRALCQIFAPF